MDHTDPLISDLAQVVREALDSAGLSINEASLAAGIPKTTLLRRLNINRPSPFLVSELSALAQAVGTTPARLMQKAMKRGAA